LYSWAYVANVATISTALLVSDSAAITAGLALIISVVSYFWTPRKYIFWGALLAFAVLCAMSAILILNTGGSSSPFIALWMIVSVFAGVFGWFGLAPLFLAVAVFFFISYTQGTLTRDAIVTIVLTGEVPLAISYLIWHTKSTTDTSSDKAYRELATELSQVANKSEIVINAIGDGVIALNSQGIIQLINPAAQQIIGWGKQDALALDYKSVLKLVDKDDHELTSATDPISTVLATNKQATSNTLSLLTNSGKKILVSLSISPVGQLGSGVIVVFRDITKEKAEEREQAEFISTASHEMRTPVASIEGYLGLALNPAIAQIDEKARDYINKAHESAQHLGRLFQDLLDVTKAEDGRLASNPKVVDVVAFAHDIVQGLKPQADAKGLRILFKPQPDDTDKSTSERRLNPVFYTNVDNDHLREVIGNLVENGIKYTPHGDVVIDVTGDTEHVTISVADSGIGIPKEDQAHLFQKFYRVDNTDTREIGGTGLGLYLCRRLTEAMNGRIWVDSEYKRGSTFYVELSRMSHEDAMRSIEAVSIQAEDQVGSAKLQFSPESTPMPAPNVPVTPLVAVPTQTIPQPVQTPVAPAITMPHPLDKTAPVNTPLTAIEQNPNQYMRDRTNGVVIPPRQ
jgi:PAS domain S-box-containing protein